LFGRAKALGVKAEVDYMEKYWIYCGHKHSLPMAVSGWTVELPEGMTDLTYGPDVKEVFNGMRECAELFVQLSLVVDDAFALSLRPHVEKAWQSFNNAAESVAREYPELLT
jgi:hypothetical protein